MKQYCYINYLGYKKVPDRDKWITTTEGEINRLIYITGGTGGYIIEGKKVEFKKNQKISQKPVDRIRPLVYNKRACLTGVFRLP